MRPDYVEMVADLLRLLKEEVRTGKDPVLAAIVIVILVIMNEITIVIVAHLAVIMTVVTAVIPSVLIVLMMIVARVATMTALVVIPVVDMIQIVLMTLAASTIQIDNMTHVTTGPVLIAVKTKVFYICYDNS